MSRGAVLVYLVCVLVGEAVLCSLLHVRHGVSQESAPANVGTRRPGCAASFFLVRGASHISRDATDSISIWEDMYLI